MNHYCRLCNKALDADNITSYCLKCIRINGGVK